MARRNTKIFVSYCHQDEDKKNMLIKLLEPLRREGLVSVWHDRQIGPGKEWQNVIEENLNRSDIILLLVSNDFLASGYCIDIEMKKALERHDNGNARVIPIILYDVAWEGTVLGSLQVLPKNGKAIELWRNENTAWKDVISGIRETISTLDQPNLWRRVNEVCNPAKWFADEYNGTNQKERKRVFVSMVALCVADYNKNLDAKAIKFVEQFDSAVKHDHKKLFVRGYEKINLYQEIVALLMDGLPDPPHCAGLDDIRPADLFANPVYPVMLRAMKKMENDNRAALDILVGELSKMQPVKNCALYEYLLGQCRRKVNPLSVDAVTAYEIGIAQVERWEQGVHQACPCEEKCRGDLLMLELHRGLGTVHRVQKKRKEAENVFSTAADRFEKFYAKIKDAKLAKVGSDIYFSYGYLLFENFFSLKCFVNKTPTDSKIINEAEKKLYRSYYELNTNFTPALARLAIISLYRKKKQKAIRQFVRVLDEELKGTSFSEMSLEKQLTAIWCYIAVHQLCVMKVGSSKYQRPVKEIEQMANLVLKKNISRGPMLCHSFDLLVIDMIFKHVLDNAINNRKLRHIINEFKKRQKVLLAS